jgi:hypothetical protein
MNIIRYSVHLKDKWNDFIKFSKNGTFILDRNYMDYHSDRFVDHSLVFYEGKDKLIAVMPTSQHGNEIISHGGLTYGGIISNRKMTVQKMLDVFSSLKVYMNENEISKLIYKRVPSIYYTYPSDEDLYALFINDAKLIRRDISTTIDLHNRISFSKGKKWGISKAKQSNVKVQEFDDFKLFFECENKILTQKYSTKSTHTYEEMKLLASRFPDNIKMFGGFLNNEFLTGTIVFITETTIHTQYIVTTDLGRKMMAFDLVVDHIINNSSQNIKYFDFGISSEQKGRYINPGLVQHKEMFGGRTIVHDFYELTM